MLMHPDNVGRPIDARWQRISDLADRGEPAKHKWDDVWIRRGLAYETRRRACRDQADRDLLARMDPDVDVAYALRHGADKLARAELEGRLLAGQSIEEVASLCARTPEVVVAYVRLFFDVEGKLDAKLYLLINAVGSRLWDGSLREGDVDLLLKWIAAIKGPILLELMLRYVKHGVVLPERLQAATAEQLEDLALMLRMRALILTVASPWPECLRGVRLCELVDELRESIPWLTTARSAAPIYVGAAFAPVADETGGGGEAIEPGCWWAAWRAEVLSA
jgi:hypothetical protein